MIKIDDPNRDGGVIFHQDVNRGKRSILLDLRRPEGREVFWRLLEDADVLVENFRQGALERLGLGYEQVRAVRPDIIYASLNTYGYAGPRAGQPGWEQLAQATTGMQMRYGAPVGERGRPALQPFAVLDFGTGLAAAYGVALALRQRRLTGLGQRVQTSLVATAGTMQSLFLPGLYGQADGLEPSGQGAKGFSPFHRLYRAADGWFFLAMTSGDLPAAEAIAGLGGLRSQTAKRIGSFLEEQFARRPVAEWVQELQGAGIGAHALRSVAEVMSDPWARSHGVALTREAPGLGLVDTIGPVAQLSRTPTQPGRPAGYAGSEGREIVRESGLSEPELQLLIDAGVVGGRL